MGKTIRNSHIIGEAGVNKFSNYCNQHNPYIIFREVVKNDFGIDAEIELTRTNEDRKTEPTGEIIKVQIKSVSTDNSYIKKESEAQFEFHPKKEDLEYWNKYIQNGIEVLLVIYDQRNDSLYCKKVSDIDIYIAKTQLAKAKKKNVNPIIFDKNYNKLVVGESSFIQKFSATFKNRVNYDVEETLLSNFLKIKSHPRILYRYKTHQKTKKELYTLVTNEEAPYFILYGGYIYTFIELGAEYKSFKTKVLTEEPREIIDYNSIVNNSVLRNHYVELINEHLKAFLWEQRLAYSKPYKRYFFTNYGGQEEVKVNVTTRKRGQYSEKSVVKFYSYGKYNFYRHVAVEFSYEFVGDDIFILVHPKYFFTEDGKKTLSPKLITKFTNFLTSREFNNHYCDWLHFWWTYLSNGKDEILVYEDPAYRNTSSNNNVKLLSKKPRITLQTFTEFKVDFGIHSDYKTRRQKDENNKSESTNTLF